MSFEIFNFFLATVYNEPDSKASGYH